MKELIKLNPGKEYGNMEELVDDMAILINDNDLLDILALDQPWKEPEKVRLSNLHEILGKRDHRHMGPLQPFKGGQSDVSFWSGVVYGAYLANVLSLNESIDLCMEMTAHGESEPFTQIRAELWKERQLRKEEQAEE
ncbi:hypothetical protein D3C85_962520 [compost metagenome]